MELKCRRCGGKFSGADGEAGFLGRMAFRFGQVEAAIPAPDTCPHCCHRDRMAFRNERSLYHRNSAVSGKQILSQYHPDSLRGAQYQVMTEEEWRSDVFDPFAYGREVDFNRPFFEQHFELHKAVPRMSLVNLQNENSPYTTHTGYSKSCYLLPCSENCDNCYYGRFVQGCNACVDCTGAERSELCYECFQISNCYRCAYLSLSQNCSQCYFSEALIGCKNCLFCTNLRQAQYCIQNRPVAPEEFEEQVSKILSSAAGIEQARTEWLALIANRPRRAANIRNSEDCTGDFILDSRGCSACTEITSCENCCDLITGYKIQDSRRSSNVYLDCELIYEMIGCTQIYHCAFGNYVFRSRDVLYSEFIYDSKDLFGCVGLTRGEYCILNRRYSPSEYAAIAGRLVRHMQSTGEWGRPVPPVNSPYGYNESVASDFSPLSREAAIGLGFLWRDINKSEAAVVSSEGPPDRIDQCSAEVTAGTYRCAAGGEPFKIIARELEFYLKNRIAPPKVCPRCRHLRREALRFPAEFHDARCAECSTPVKTNLPPQMHSSLRCEQCYQRQF